MSFMYLNLCVYIQYSYLWIRNHHHNFWKKSVSPGFFVLLLHILETDNIISWIFCAHLHKTFFLIISSELYFLQIVNQNYLNVLDLTNYLKTIFSYKITLCWFWYWFKYLVKNGYQFIKTCELYIHINLEKSQQPWILKK